MKVIIRIQSPQLARFVQKAQKPKPRIERLPDFSVNKTSAFSGRVSSPFAVWVSSMAIFIACLCLAMVATVDSGRLPTFRDVSRNMSVPAASAPRPPEASFPYGSVPPMQSVNVPTARPALVIAGGGVAR
jgi:hypothetical protein